MFRVLFWTFVQSFMLLSPIFAQIALTVGKFYDVLAATLDFNFSENFKVWHRVQKKSTHHFGVF